MKSVAVLKYMFLQIAGYQCLCMLYCNKIMLGIELQCFHENYAGLDLKLGQVSGLALDPENNLVVFHRGDHVWDEK